MDVRPLPSRPSLEHYRKQAKALHRALRERQETALQQLVRDHPRFRRRAPAEIDTAELKLADAQLVIARQHGFASWPKFQAALTAMASAGSPVSRFERAADAIVEGDLAGLAGLLDEDPALVSARSERAHGATLLHYVGSNGIEDYRQKAPANLVEIARLLLDRGAEVDAVGSMYGLDTAYTLAATSIHPAEVGVLVPLLELLRERGASVDGPPGAYPVVNACLANGRPQGAHVTAGHGARIDLEGAAGIGDLARVRSFCSADGGLQHGATVEQRNAGFMWACEYGQDEVVRFLLDQGVDVMTEVGGMTGPHWAANNWQDSTLALLIARGARLETRNAYGGTVLGNAVWAVFHNHPVHRWPRIGADYLPMLRRLLEAGADPGQARFPTGNARVDDLLRAFGAS